jgi:hypothetical protein
MGTFNTYSVGPTHRSLMTQQGYIFGGAAFPCTTPQPSQPTVSTFHQIAPPSLSLNIIYQISQVEFKGPMTATWSFDHSAIYCGLYLRLVIAIGLSLAIGFTRIDQKVVLIQLGYQSNFCNRMHI